MSEMSEWMDNRSEKELKIEAKASEYGIELDAVIIYCMVYGVNLADYNEVFYKEIIEIVEMIRLLRTCRDNPIILRGCVVHPSSCLRKNWKQDACLSYGVVVDYLVSALFNLLDDMGVGYDCEDDVSDEKLAEDIEEFRKSLNDSPTYTKNASAGEWMSRFYRYLFKVETSEGMTKRKAYSFLYDCYSIVNGIEDLGEGYSGEIGREKAQYVRNCIMACDKKNDGFYSAMEESKE